MASATPAAAIEARLKANWTTTPIFVGNPASVQPPVGADSSQLPFVVLEFPGAVAQQWEIGNPPNNTFREDGAFMLHVGIVAGTEQSIGRGWCDQLALIFRGRDFDGVTCWECNPPSPGGPSGLYEVLSFGTRYHYEYRGV